MTPEEFLEFLEKYKVLDSRDSGDILDELNVKFPHAKTSRKFGL
jgi:hypothetical protein